MYGKGTDPISFTGTKDSIDPETGALGTAGTPLTTGYGQSGSTIGTGSGEGEREFKEGDYSGSTPASEDYDTGKDRPEQMEA
jgi:hypothetical protein